MPQEMLQAVVLVLVGGVLMGSFLIPTRGTPRWPWECYWFHFAVFGTLLCPWLWASWTNADLGAAFRLAPVDAVVKTFLFGILWGIGGCLFGIGVNLVGMALGFALIIGITTVVGSLTPIIFRDPGKLATPGGRWTVVGVAVLLAGVAVLSLAGKARDRHRSARLGEAADPAARPGAPASRFAMGLLVCAVSGAFSSMLNIAFEFSDEIARAAEVTGSTKEASGDAVWVVILTGGFLANFGLSAFKLTRNRTWGLLARAPLGYWPLGFLVGALWYAGTPLFGRGKGLMGELGGSVGWGIFMASLIVTSNLWGLALGEWKGAGPHARKLLAAGLLVLFGGIALLARAGAAG